MKRNPYLALPVIGLALAIAFLALWPDNSRSDHKAMTSNGRSSSGNPHTSSGPGKSFDPSSPSYLEPASLGRLLALSDLEIRKALESLDDVQVSSILNALGRMTAADISSRGDYALADRLIGALKHDHSAKILEWMFHSKSPRGSEVDLLEQTELIAKYSSGNPSEFLKGNFLRDFGLLHGDEVAKSGITLLLNNEEYLSYLDGVCKTSREATFGNLLLIRDEALLKTAVEKAVPSLLTADALGFSEYLGKMPPSDTKDLAILQMIKWLTEKKADAECAPWLEAIHSPRVKMMAVQLTEDVQTEKSDFPAVR